MIVSKGRVFPRARRRHLMRAEQSLMSTGVSSRPAELTEGDRNVRTRSAGVAVHGGCVPAVLTQLEFTMRGCSGQRLRPGYSLVRANELQILIVLEIVVFSETPESRNRNEQTHIQNSPFVGSLR